MARRAAATRRDVSALCALGAVRLDAENAAGVGNGASACGAGSAGARAVLAVLDEWQRGPGSMAAQREALRRLDKERGAAGAEAVGEALVHALDVACAAGRRDAGAERVLSLLGKACSERADGSGEAFVGNGPLQVLLARCLELSGASDATVRARACGLCGAILEAAPGDGAFLSEALWDRLERVLVLRLQRDKAPAVRAAAARAVERLQQSSSVSDPVCAALVLSAGADSSAEVRCAALRAVALCPASLVALVGRSRDAKEAVRAVALEQVAARASARALSIAQRRALLDAGLQDRAPKVRAAALAMLEGWLAQAEGCPLRLLRLLDPEASPATSSRALCALWDSGSAVAERDVLGAAGAGTPLALTAEGALYLAARCEWLVARGLDVPDALVPDLGTLCSTLRLCLQALRNARGAQPQPQPPQPQPQQPQQAHQPEEDEEAAERLEFALSQLLAVPALLDARHDVVGQNALFALVTELTECRELQSSAAMDAAMVVLGVARAADVAGLVRQGSQLVLDCLEPVEAQEEDEEQAAEEARRLEEEARVRLAACVAAEDYEGAALCKKQLLALSEPRSRAPEPWRAERALALTEALLRAVRAPPRSVAVELGSVLDRVVLPVLMHRDDKGQQRAPAPVSSRRQQAIRCLALAAQVEPTPARARGVLPVLVEAATAEPEEAATRSDALRGVFDLAVVFGLAALTESEEAAEDLMFRLLELLDSDLAELKLCAAEGFAKLAVTGRLVDERVLQCLMVLNFHPSTESATRLRQCLAVCLPVLAEHTQSGRKALEAMAAPFVQAVAHPAPDSPMAEVPLEAVMGYLCFLLGFSDAQQQSALALAVMAELAADPRGESVRALAKVLGSGALPRAGAEDAPAPTRALIKGAAADLAQLDLGKDAVAKRALDKWLARAQAFGGDSPDEALLAKWRADVAERRAQLATEALEGLKVAAAAEADEPRRRRKPRAATVSKPPAPTKRTLTRKAQRESWNSSDEEEASERSDDEES
jgi:hypothetical protein